MENTPYTNHEEIEAPENIGGSLYRNGQHALREFYPKIAIAIVLPDNGIEECKILQPQLARGAQDQKPTALELNGTGINITNLRAQSTQCHS